MTKAYERRWPFLAGYVAYSVYACAIGSERSRLVRRFSARKDAIRFARRFSRAAALGTLPQCVSTQKVYYVVREFVKGK